VKKKPVSETQTVTEELVSERIVDPQIWFNNELPIIDIKQSKKLQELVALSTQKKTKKKLWKKLLLSLNHNYL
jgi:hypothetical protein